MSAFGMEGFGTMRAVEVDVYTAAYRVSGTVQTRFNRVAEILNQLSGAHLAVEHATVSEHGEDGGTLGAPSVLVAVEHILLMAAAIPAGETASEMRIPKRPVRAQLAIPPFRVTGNVHVPMGSRPVDGLLNVTERFLPMTDVTLASAAYPQLERSAAVVALRRERAHLLLVADDERPDQLLAEILDERTAEAWLRGHGDQPG
ncbi:MAG TPA: hypothetical protein VHQ42_08670 [Candidatus Limnocylindria bacterium]|nr:hypothetical protein [Candidatus Limnocylindria bacterium]